MGSSDLTRAPGCCGPDHPAPLSVPAIPTNGLARSGGIIPAVRINGMSSGLTPGQAGYRAHTYQTLGWLER